jgi:hypothetical protein
VHTVPELCAATTFASQAIFLVLRSELRSVFSPNCARQSTYLTTTDLAAYGHHSRDGSCAFTLSFIKLRPPVRPVNRDRVLVSIVRTIRKQQSQVHLRTCFPSWPAQLSHSPCEQSVLTGKKDGQHAFLDGLCFDGRSILPGGYCCGFINTTAL